MHSYKTIKNSMKIFLIYSFNTQLCEMIIFQFFIDIIYLNINVLTNTFNNKSLVKY